MDQKSRMDASQRGQKPITITWRMEDLREVGLAKTKFKSYIKAGWLAFAVTSNNKREQIFEFDPKLKTIILILFAEGG